MRYCRKGAHCTQPVPKAVNRSDFYDKQLLTAQCDPRTSRTAVRHATARSLRPSIEPNSTLFSSRLSGMRQICPNSVSFLRRIVLMIVFCLQLLSGSVIGDFLMPSIECSANFDNISFQKPKDIFTIYKTRHRQLKGSHCLPEFRFCKRLFKEKVHHNSGVFD